MSKTLQRKTEVNIFSHLGASLSTNLFDLFAEELTCPGIPPYLRQERFAWVGKIFPDRDLNPGLNGESVVS